jgi:hypothetical protein
MAVKRLTASCQRLADPAVLLLTYRLEGDIGRLCLASPLAPVRVDGLWRHTCLEAFVQPVDEAPGGTGANRSASRYGEYNFSPDTRWAAYDFDGCRQGMRPRAGVPEPQVAVQTGADALVLTARIVLPPQDVAGPLRVGLTAVIEERGAGGGDAPGQRSWWALSHTADKPDFHQSASFILELPRVVSPVDFVLTRRDPFAYDGP